MPENGATREMVEAVVSAVFDAQAARLRDEVVLRVMERLSAASPNPAASGGTALLQRAAAEIQQASSQSEILSALLDGTASFATRAAVFLLRAGAAIGWQARDFRANDSLKLLTVESGSGLAQQAIAQRSAVSGKAAEFDARFVEISGAPFDASCLLVPLTVRDKAVALVYADAGSEPGGVLDPSALQLLTGIAGIWLELLALRKSSGTGAPAAVPQSGAVAEPAPAAAAQESVLPPSSPGPVRDSVSPPVSVASVLGDEELHRKARRFAKLLVEEIKLYNLPKVRDGRLHHNLYDRLKDDIEKSRATYDQRYANTPVASADYFTQELVRGLADGDTALFGSNFPR